MFSKVSSRVSFPDMEREVLRYWKEHQIFEKSEQGEDKALFMFYEGPPTANGSPGIHHVLARAFKDVICRYKTMKGFRPLRKGGWDTHGLPVELEVERELGLTSKRQIEEYGIAEFNEKCRESVFKYVKEWEDLTDRIGYWVDMKGPLCDPAQFVHRDGVVDSEGDVAEGADLQGDEGDAALPALREFAEFPRGGVGVSGEYAGPFGLCEVSGGGCGGVGGGGWGRCASVGVSAGVDDYAVDAAGEYCAGGGPTGELQPG